MIRGGTRGFTGLLIVIIVLGQARVAAGVSSAPLSLALSILPQKLPADGNVYPGVIVSLVDSAGQPTIALNGTQVLLTSSLESVGKVQPSVTIPIGRAFAIANFTTTSAPGTTTITATGVGLRPVSTTLVTVTATGYPTHLSIIALPDTVPAALRGSGRLLIALQDDVGLPAKAISD